MQIPPVSLPRIAFGLHPDLKKTVALERLELKTSLLRGLHLAMSIIEPHYSHIMSPASQEMDSFIFLSRVSPLEKKSAYLRKPRAAVVAHIDDRQVQYIKEFPHLFPLIRLTDHVYSFTQVEESVMRACVETL